jgi:hypothetical protein
LITAPPRISGVEHKFGRDRDRDPGQRGRKNRTMTNRTMTTAVAGRSSSMRRLRRRASAAQRPYCRTNGCASFLELDSTTGVARCPVCGYGRRLS